MSIIQSMSSFLVKSLSEDNKLSSTSPSSVNLFLRGDVTLCIVEKLLSSSADDTGSLLLKKFYARIDMY